MKIYTCRQGRMTRSDFKWNLISWQNSDGNLHNWDQNRDFEPIFGFGIDDCRVPSTNFDRRVYNTSHSIYSGRRWRRTTMHQWIFTCAV